MNVALKIKFLFFLLIVCISCSTYTILPEVVLHINNIKNKPLSEVEIGGYNPYDSTYASYNKSDSLGIIKIKGIKSKQVFIPFAEKPNFKNLEFNFVLKKEGYKDYSLKLYPNSANFLTDTIYMEKLIKE
jgi:hypothetical protein